jgi:translation initiation factor eIF-2B subunit alpha
LGTYQVALIAKMTRKPFYVAVESYKFARMYPLSQRDIADLCQGEVGSGKIDFENSPSAPPINTAGDGVEESIDKKIEPSIPVIDFTPAEYITLLFTDIGVLTPAAVSDELIRLYQ